MFAFPLRISPGGSAELIDFEIQQFYRRMQTTYSQSSQPSLTRSNSSRAPARKAPKSQTQPGHRRASLTLALPDAITVAVAGTFNNWDPGRTPMTKNDAGAWNATLSLPPGRYEYRFVVDGDWISDPEAEDSVENPFGQTNSVLVVC
jgi:1,4-alpha-glucan branching enzyme